MSLLLSAVDHGFLAPFLRRTGDLYSAIDKAYADAALHYGFACRGCVRNCCEERFYHYTLTEYLFLRSGVALLEREEKSALFRRAEEVIRLYRLHDALQQHERVMCPLNQDGFCVLYAYRPMICRLQGIPHSVKKAGQPPRRGPGCHAFDESIRADNIVAFDFDHTPFYLEMAGIETEIRNGLRYKDRCKKTVADMLLDMDAADSRGHQ